LSQVLRPRPSGLEFQHSDAILGGYEAIDRASHDPAVDTYRERDFVKRLALAI
jgi:hypothetical protein